MKSQAKTKFPVNCRSKDRRGNICEYCEVIARDGRITINNIPTVMSPCELPNFDGMTI